MLSITAVIMASGLSRRMGTNKLLLPFQGKTLLGRTLALLETLPLKERILVCTPETAQVLSGKKELSNKIRVIHNVSPEQGQSVSMRLGLQDAHGDGVIFFTGDQPLLDAEALMPIMEAATPDNIVVPYAGGTPRSPVYFAMRFRPELSACSGDKGGRPVRDAHPESCCKVEVYPPWKFTDIDTPEQYAALLEQKIAAQSG